MTTMAIMIDCRRRSFWIDGWIDNMSILNLVVRLLYYTPSIYYILLKLQCTPTAVRSSILSKVTFSSCIWFVRVDRACHKIKKLCTERVDIRLNICLFQDGGSCCAAINIRGVERLEAQHIHIYTGRKQQTTHHASHFQATLAYPGCTIQHPYWI